MLFATSNLLSMMSVMITCNQILFDRWFKQNYPHLQRADLAGPHGPGSEQVDESNGSGATDQNPLPKGHSSSSDEQLV